MISQLERPLFALSQGAPVGGERGLDLEVLIDSSEGSKEKSPYSLTLSIKSPTGVESGGSAVHQDPNGTVRRLCLSAST